MKITIESIDRVVHNIQSRIKYQLNIGLILGTGLGGLADTIQNATIIPYCELPDWPISTVMGHSGKLVIGELEEHPIRQTSAVQPAQGQGAAAQVFERAAGAVKVATDSGAQETHLALGVETIPQEEVAMNC